MKNMCKTQVFWDQSGQSELPPTPRTGDSPPAEESGKRAKLLGTSDADGSGGAI